MPGSIVKGKLTISKWYQGIPKKKFILDVGPGWATYSKLLRSGGEIWHAVEIYKPYVDRYDLNKHYDKVFVNDIKKFDPKIIYDIVILGDVVEHLNNKDSIHVLKKLFVYSRWCIISLPLTAETHYPSENASSYFGNIHERHIGSWSNKLFLRTVIDLGGEIVAMEKYFDLAIYLIATQAKGKYTSEHFQNPKDWFLSKYSNWFKNKEEGIIQEYVRRIIKLIYNNLTLKSH